MQQKTPPSTQPTFESFYQESFAGVVGLLLRLGADPHEAEDATQTAMIALMSRWDSVHDPAPWVRVVAKNTWLRSVSRARGTIPAGSAADVAETVPSDAAENPETRHSSSLEQRAALGLLRTLPLAQREVLALTFDGLQPSEIAAVTGKPAKIVRSNLTHARRRLRHRITDSPAPVAGSAAPIELFAWSAERRIPSRCEQHPVNGREA
ncbi:RNA polymerase sigma factor [Actinoplanes sp. GCM10030250]|uniref:RNA polymerase sigma factor n=1 Tax=Actinoplanes sp. GCM10030250 TaxID=3273376 RepID=UPI00361B4340